MLQDIDWQEHPAPIAPGTRLDLIRCKTGSLPPLIVLSERHVGTEIHWYNGRSFPHLKNGCPACAAKRPGVWKGYLAVWQPKARVPAILEFTARCTSALDAHYLAYGTLRAAAVTLTRKGTKEKGPLTLDVTMSQHAPNDLPAAPDIRRALTAMWNAARQEEDLVLEPGRPVVEPAMNNDELRRRQPARFARETTDDDETEDRQSRVNPFAKTRDLDNAPTNRNGKPQP